MYDIAIWTPINKINGFGHFYRMMGIYELLKEHNISVTYFTNTDYIKLETVDVLECKKEDIEDIVIFLKRNMIQVLIIDNYNIMIEDIKYLSKHFKIVLFDAKFENPNVDILMNFNPYARSEYPTKHDNTLYFLGLKYMNFRNDLQKVHNNIIHENTIFISIGGTDITNTTYKLLKYLSSDFTYHIVLGKGCSDSYYLKIFKFLNNNNNTFYLYKQPKDYFEIMSKCEFAISSCSTTSYELIYLSKPFVCINVASNQNMITSYLNEEGIVTLGTNNLENIGECIEKKLFNKITIRQNKNNKSLLKAIENLLY